MCSCTHTENRVVCSHGEAPLCCLLLGAQVPHNPRPGEPVPRRGGRWAAGGYAGSNALGHPEAKGGEELSNRRRGEVSSCASRPDGLARTVSATTPRLWPQRTVPAPAAARAPNSGPGPPRPPARAQACCPPEPPGGSWRAAGKRTCGRCDWACASVCGQNGRKTRIQLVLEIGPGPFLQGGV